MDSYVLAETFKYLFLLFSEEEDLVLDMEDFVFNTEAHIFPLSLANINATLNQIIQDTVSQKKWPLLPRPIPSSSMLHTRK